MFQRDQSDSKKNANAKHWLVKSGEKILGPFTFDEVVTKLKSKELVSIDEVVKPQSRWRVIRDDPVFKEAVDEIRRAQLGAREDTEIQSNTSHTFTNTLTDPEATKGDTSATANTVTREIAVIESSYPPAEKSSDSLHYDQSQIQDAEFEEVTPVAPARPAVNKPRDVRQYGISGQENAYRGQSKFVSFIWFVAAAMAIGAFVLVMRTRTQSNQRGAAVGESFESLKAKANTAWSHGDFKTAMSLYQKANEQNENQPEITARLAPLLIQLQSGSGEAKRMLNETLKELSGRQTKPSDASLQSEVETGLGLAALASEDLVEAESRFKASIEHGSKLFATRFDLAMVSYLAKSYSEAAKRFNEAGDDGPALFMRARALLANDKSAGFREAETALERASSKYFDFRQESLVLLASIDLESGDKGGAATLLRWALDTDPDLTSDHWHDPLLYLQPLGWRELVPRCQRLNDEIKNSSARALLALCLFKAGDADEAQRIVREALGQWPEEPILEAVSAAMLFSAGRPGDARAALKIATAKSGDIPLLAQIIRGKVCATTGDNKCAEQTWRHLSDQKQATLTALTGLAEQLLLRGETAKANELVKKVRDLSPRYRPTMSIKKGGT